MTTKARNTVPDSQKVLNVKNVRRKKITENFGTENSCKIDLDKSETPKTVPEKKISGDPHFAISSDPLDISLRLYRQLGKLLDEMEGMDRDETMTFSQRVSAMIAIGRLQKIFVDLRKGSMNVSAGSAVARYQRAFAKTHDPSSRSQAAGPSVSNDGDDGDDNFDIAAE